VDEWHFIAERKIREAMDEGAFDQLEGEGEPLDLSENPYEDASLRMAHRLLKNNGFAPAWVEEAKEIDAEYRRLLTYASSSTKEFRERVERLNKRILVFNLKAPTVSVHRQPFRP
jgi:Domain of unknown function (DUF1992)